MTPLILLAILIGPQPAAPPRQLAGVFEGRTPCGLIANAFTGFPAQNCEKIKWELTLRLDGDQGGTYEYRGTRTSHTGRWRLERRVGPEKTWTILRLQGADERSQNLTLLRVDDNVLLLMDRDLKILVGDASWSYALNRTDRVR